MKRLATLLTAFAILLCGAAYGNRFLDGMVGRWSETATVVVSVKGKFVDKTISNRETHTTKLSNGTYYSVKFNERKKAQESWYFKNGKLSFIFYSDEEVYDGEGAGTWRIRNG